jgi:hypothetical protein
MPVRSTVLLGRIDVTDVTALVSALLVEPQ